MAGHNKLLILVFKNEVKEAVRERFGNISQQVLVFPQYLIGETNNDRYFLNNLVNTML